LHERDPKGTVLDTGDFLPDARDKEWESPIPVNDIQEFLEEDCIVEFDEGDSLTHDKTADSRERLEMPVFPEFSDSMIPLRAVHNEINSLDVFGFANVAELHPASEAEVDIPLLPADELNLNLAE
jgi:hypothetical protein